MSRSPIAYGGVLFRGVVREMMIRAFLVEEKQIENDILQIQKAKKK